MTTRSVKSAKVMIKNPTHRNIVTLEGLSDNDCWRLFQQHAGDGSDLAEMQVDIIKKCKGLPLAAKALGGLLKSTEEKSQYKKILESDIWSEESRVLPVLQLSYHHLPSHLKRVFAYCSVFPKDHEFEKMEVILLWMAQGFLPPDNEIERMEDIGHKYFDDLVSRSLFEPVSYDDDDDDDDEKKFIMHYLIHDMAQLAAGDMDMQRDRKRTRHLFLTANHKDEILENQLKATQLRTLLCQDYYRLGGGPGIENLDFIVKLQYVRSLCLVSASSEELPEIIGDLKHLRYLSLKLKRIKVLPKSISKLYHLQTLDVRGCYKLEEVPNISFLVKLRHMYIDGTSLREMPMGIGKLTNLQTLDNFVLAAGKESRVRELRNLNHLCEKLVISGLENLIEVESAREAHLHDKKGLTGLYLEWGTCWDEVDDNTKRDVLERLEPHTSIKECRLKRYMGLKFPGWLGDTSFKHIVHIRLLNCEKCECLPALGQLPSLKNLVVSGMNGIKEVGPEFYGSCSTPFPALRTLHLHSMKSWEKWVHSSVDNDRLFPCLEKLSIWQCESLQGDIPPHLPLLKILTIYDCKEMRVSLPSLRLLEVLSVEECKVLSTTAEIICSSEHMKLRDIVEIIDLPGHFTCSGEVLSIHNCQSLITYELHLIQLTSLKGIEFWKCKNMERLPSELHKLTSLQRFSVLKCPKIESLPEGGLPRNLTTLEIVQVNIKQPVQHWGLHLLTSLHELSLFEVGSSVDSIEYFPSPDLSLSSSLSQLRISGFQNLKSISNSSTLPNLTKLVVSSCPKLESLNVGHFTSLQDLSIELCPKLGNFPEDDLPRNLWRLIIRETKIEKAIQEWGLHLLTSLVDLELEDVGSSSDTVECISDIHFPIFLYELKIKGFQNLKSISCSTLPNLIIIRIKSCPKFESFGDNSLSQQIEYVYIEECDPIEQHLKRDPSGRVDTKNGRCSLC